MRDSPHRSDQASLTELFWGVARRLRHTSTETLAPWDVSPSQHRALQVLRRGGAMRAGKLSGFLRIAPRSATEVIDALEQRGLVQRRADPDDRRATLIDLTEEGHRVVEAIFLSHANEADEFFGRLSDSDRAHLTRILRKLTDSPPD